MTKNKAFFFDRDGVLNKAVIKQKKPFPPNNIKELIIENFVEEIIIYLKKLNYKIFIFTNQPDVSRKTIKKKSLCHPQNLHHPIRVVGCGCSSWHCCLWR